MRLHHVKASCGMPGVHACHNVILKNEESPQRSRTFAPLLALRMTHETRHAGGASRQGKGRMKPRTFIALGQVSAKAWCTLLALGAMLLALVVTPIASDAQAQTCTNCVLYAGTELNLRQEPSLTGIVLRFIPRGAAVQRTAGAEQNGYAPVIYDNVPGWAVALGFVATPEEVKEFVVPSTATPTTSPTATAVPSPTPTSQPPSSDLRVTLSPLLLRSGPAGDAEPILTMPQGAQVTLTREGAENGYVTVDYGGTRGWAYADLLG
jgi:uncharacterized protein YraI